MNYKIITFKRHNIISAPVHSDAEYLLFVEEGATLASDAINQLKKYISAASEKTVAFELRTVPADSGHHTDPVSLEIPYIDSAAVAIQRDAFEKAGGFDTHFCTLAFIDLSWRLRSAGYILQACPKAVVTSERVSDERFEYIHGAYEKLLLGYKWGYSKQQKAVFEHTMKNPRHFEGVRKELAKLYAKHFLHITAMKAAAKKHPELYKSEIADFSDHFGPWRGQQHFSEPENSPLVSVVVRTHKRKEVLRHTLRCLRNQIYDNFEVVVVEDGEDTAGDMIRTDFADMNISYYSTGTNVGRGRAGNIGIEMAKGEFVAFLDDDDFYYPDFISGHVAKFMEHPEADVVISGIMAVKSTTLSIDPFEFEYSGMYPVLFDHITLMDMCVKCRIPMTGAMFRRKMYDICGGMREDIGGDEDWVMWLKYITRGNRINIYNADINRAMSMFLYPADEAAAQKRLDGYEVFDKIMLYDESLLFDVEGSEIRKWEEYVRADINHLKNIGKLDAFTSSLKPLGIEKMEYNADTVNKISARQINNYYYWLVAEYSK